MLAASMMFACSPFEPEIPEVDPKPIPDPEEPVVTRDVIFSATTETMADWAAGDKISIFDGKAVLTATNAERINRMLNFSAGGVNGNNGVIS